MRILFILNSTFFLFMKSFLFIQNLSDSFERNWLKQKLIQKKKET